MTGNLLDTNTVLISLTDPDRLPAAVRSAVLAKAGLNVLSVVCFWEVLLKGMKGNLDVGDPRTWWSEALDQLAATPLALRPRHVAGVYTLPPHHKDPFDRILVAQSITEELTLITIDREIPLYASAGLQFIS